MAVTIVISGNAVSSASILQGDTLITVPVKLNNVVLPDSLVLREMSGGTQVEVRKFISLVGGSFHPFSHIFLQDGMMVQYGNFISFAGLENPLGFVSCKMVEVQPPVSLVQNENTQVYFAPLSFLASAIGGTATYDAVNHELDITVASPSVFGSAFPPAADVAEALTNSGYTVQQGEISKLDPVDFCRARYTPNANGNNAAFPYMGIQLPPSPGKDTIYYIPITFTLKEEEAVVMVGQTPPECKYFSYRSYLMNRYFEFPPQTTRTKINASLGNTQSLYSMRKDLPVDSIFNRKYALIMAADSLIAMEIKNMILAATSAITEKDIYFDIVPHEIIKFGNTPKGDWLNMVHRVVLFDDADEENSYLYNPPLEIMRVTPNDSSERVYFKTPGFLPKSSGINEFHLMPELELLEDGIYDAYHNTHQIIWIQPSPWVIEGYTAIQEGADAIGEVQDALYIITSDFQLNDNDLALVYGVDHTKTGQAVYTNINIYQRKYMNGFCGVTNFEMEKSARQFVSDTVIADQLFAYTLSRHPVAGNPFNYVIPLDTFNTLKGINLEDSVFIGTRLYINSVTKIAPDPQEVILDRTVLLRPFLTGITAIDDRKQSPALRVYPNPVYDKATLEFSISEWSEVNLTLYNSSGQQVGKTIQFDHARGTILQELQMNRNLPSGEYFLRGIISETETADQRIVTSKILFVGGKNF